LLILLVFFIFILSFIFNLNKIIFALIFFFTTNVNQKRRF